MNVKAYFQKFVDERYMQKHQGQILESVSCAEAMAFAELWAAICTEELQQKLNTPELDNFAKAVVLEAVHQRDRWGEEHDAGKSAEDWFWVIGYLAGKALCASKSGDTEKLKHHVITTAAVLNNWHAQILGVQTAKAGSINPEQPFSR